MKRATWEGIALSALGLLLWLAVAGARPVAPGDLVDPAVTPADVRPEWYFLALYTLLRYVPEWLGVLLPGAIVVALAALPFLAPGARGLRHRLIQIAAAAAALAYAALTIIGFTPGGGG